MKERKRIVTPAYRGVLSGGVALLLLVGHVAPVAAAAPTQGQPDQRAAGEVVVRVNGSPIYQDDVEAGLPEDAFGSAIRLARSKRIERLIHLALMKQFLAKQGLSVSDQRIDQGIEELRETPPPAGCICCRYESLEQYMTLSHITMPELREMIRVDAAMAGYLEGVWRKAYPTAASRASLLEKERGDLASKYIKVSHIFLNVFQDPDVNSDRKGVLAAKEKQAEKAWKRLADGHRFETVAREMSEDILTRRGNGLLGCIPKDMFGREFAAAVEALEHGQYSKPVESPWGLHVIRREVMTDDDLLEVVGDRFKREAEAAVVKKLREAAEIVRLDDEME